MSRIARTVAPGVAHHVTQRGVRSLAIFRDDDRRTHLTLMREQAGEFSQYCDAP